VPPGPIVVIGRAVSDLRAPMPDFAAAVPDLRRPCRAVRRSCPTLRRPCPICGDHARFAAVLPGFAAVLPGHAGPCREDADLPVPREPPRMTTGPINGPSEGDGGGVQGVNSTPLWV